MPVVQFKDETFVELIARELEPGYNMLGLDELEEDGADLITFVGAIASAFLPEEGQEGIDYDALLLVKADELGVVSRFYGPSLYNDDEHGLIIKVGKNKFAVKQEKGTLGTFKCGDLEGDLAFGEPTKMRVKDDAGEEVEVDYHPAYINLMDPAEESDDPCEYKVRVTWIIDPKVEFSTSKVKLRAAKCQSIAELLQAPPSGGGSSWLRMQELGKGKYPIASIKDVSTKYGENYVLVLDDGREVIARGKVKTQLDCGYVMKSNLTLIVSKVEQRGDRWFVDCALREAAKEKPKKEEKGKEKELVAVGAASAESDAEVDYDAIPF